MKPTEALPYFSDALADATRLTRISMESTERVVALQLGFAKAATAAAFDTYSRAARHVTSLTDASVMSAAPKKKRN